LDIIIPKDKTDDFNEIYLVFEYASGDLKKLFKSDYNLEPNQII